MNLFGEEAVVAGSTSAVRQIATDTAGRPSCDPHGQKARVQGGFAAGAQDWSKPVGTPPGTFTITAVPLFRMTRGGCELVQCGIRIAVDIDEEMFGSSRFPIHLPAARAPNGIRTRAAALKGRCPRPLDDGGVVGFGRRGRHQPAVGTAPA